MVMIVKFKPAHKNNNSSAPLTLRNIGGVWREVPTYSQGSFRYTDYNPRSRVHRGIRSNTQ